MWEPQGHCQCSSDTSQALNVPRITLDHPTRGHLSRADPGLTSRGCSGLFRPWPKVPQRQGSCPVPSLVPGARLRTSGTQDILTKSMQLCGRPPPLSIGLLDTREWHPLGPPSTRPRCPRPCGFLLCLSTLRLGGQRSEETGAVQDRSWGSLHQPGQNPPRGCWQAPGAAAVPEGPGQGKEGPHLSRASAPNSPALPPTLPQAALTLVLSSADSTMVTVSESVLGPAVYAAGRARSFMVWARGARPPGPRSLAGEERGARRRRNRRGRRRGVCANESGGTSLPVGAGTRPGRSSLPQAASPSPEAISLPPGCGASRFGVG